MPALFLSIFLVMGSFAILLPSVMYVLANMGVSPSMSTPVLAGYSVAQFLAGPFWGRISDRHGRRPVLLVTLFGCAASYLAMALFAHSVVGVFTCFAVAGLFSGNSAVVYAAVTDLTGRENRARGMGFMGAGIGLAFTLGPALGAWLGGDHVADATLHAPALASAAASAIGLLVVGLSFRESLDRSGEQPDGTVGRIDAFRRIGTSPALTQMALMMLIFTIALAMMEPIMPLLTRDRFGWGPREMGQVFAYIGFVLVLVQGGLVGRLVKRFGEQALVRAGLVSMLFGLLALTFDTQKAGIFIGLTLTSIGGALFNTAMLALASHRATSGDRGLVMGAFQSMQSLGRSAGPLVTGYFYQIMHTLPLLAGAAGMALLIGWFLVLARKVALEDEETAA
ncbi:MAG: MFS transporter [Alphaproteobacteria bacterium]|nr:MAG: MFS transporter [Alphaproteobacteria bacterium]